MSDMAKKSVGTRFFIKQAALLVTTILLVIFCTIPVFSNLKTAINPSGLYETLDKKNKEFAALQERIDVVQSKMLMGAGDEEGLKRLMNEIEDLKIEAVRNQAEIKYLKSELEKAKDAVFIVASLRGKPVPGGDNPFSWRNTVENVSRVFGTLGSFLTGTMFVSSWWLRRRETVVSAR